jgi:hypothetical protein
MGMVGLFVGPVLMALLVAIWREWLLTTDSDILSETTRETAPAMESAPDSVAVAAATIVPSKASSVWPPAEVHEIAGAQRVAETQRKRPDEVLPSSPHSLQKGAQL